MRAALRKVGIATAGLATSTVACHVSSCMLETGASKKNERRIPGIPARLDHQCHGLWDNNWDNCAPQSPEDKTVKKALGEHLSQAATAHNDGLKNVVRQLYAEPGSGHLAAEAVEVLIKDTEDLLGLFLKALVKVRGAKRHFILVRHGQYKQDTTVESEKVLTPLGREQATKTGKRLAEALKAALTSSGRGKKRVRIHVSTMVRAVETADLIAAQFPEGAFKSLPPNPLLVEGSPPVHNIPDPLYSAKDVHRSLMEAGFRSIFHRLPLRDEPDSGKAIEATVVGTEAGDQNSSQEQTVHDEYDIVVCHANVIRYITLRALQLPPEAWFRLHPRNGSITHLRVGADGSVDLFGFGESSHLTVDENTFNMISRYPYK